MILYHGTREIVYTVDFGKCRLRTDFGKGFYISSKLNTARTWAIGKAGFSGIPTVMRYEINNNLFNDSTLSIMRFDHPSKEWLDFIKDNRHRDLRKGNSPEPRHVYDVVSGPIANDKVADVVDLYCKGKIDADEAIARTKALPSVFQLSLHTSQALNHVLSTMYSQREGGKWSTWIPSDLSRPSTD
jgi:hypothetical protein